MPTTSTKPKPKPKSEIRKRNANAYLVRVDAAEDKKIQANANGHGLTPSAFLRQLGINKRPQSIIDAGQIKELVKTRGDLGRLGGLLKLWLTDDEKVQHFSTRQIHDMVNKIDETLDDLRQEIRRLTK